MKKLLITLLALVMCVKLSAQVETNYNNEKGVSIEGVFKKAYQENIFNITPPDMNIINQKEKQDRESADVKPFRIADPVATSIDVVKLASWILDEKTAYAKFSIVAAKAKSLSINFNSFFLPYGTEMSIYNSDGTMITGPVTEKENNMERIWGSSVYQGEKLTIEIKIPIVQKEKLQLNISNVAYGYKEIFRTKTYGAGQSGSCNINVFCTLGNGWEDERKSVALILNQNGSFWCSGVMVNNTCLINLPYFLTANHCLNNGSENVGQWRFVFKFWSTTCTSNNENTNTLLFNGSVLKANNSTSDFALLQLYQTPASNSDITYAGWSRSSAAATQGTGIHHPSGDLMKISRSSALQRTGYGTSGTTHWQANWTQGVTERGSSGSPLFDQNHRVVGQLHGGPSACNVSQLWDYYGSFDVSWTGGGTNTTRLSNWLDPTNTGATTTNTTNISALFNINTDIVGPSQFCTSQTYSISALPPSATVSWSAAYPFVSYSQSNNILTINRIDDGDATIYATINVCGETFYKQRTVRVGGAPITVTATQLSCDEFQFDVAGAAPGASYSWSSPYNTILFNGTSTTATTSYPTINGTTMGGDAARVNTTNTCNQSVDRYAQLYNIYTRNIDGIFEVYSNGDQVVGSVNTTPYDTYYRWYINGYLDSEGADLSGFATFNGQGGGIMCGENTIRVEVDACGGTVSSDVVHFWKMGNCFSRNTPATNVELFPNPAFNQTTIRLTDTKESSVKLTSIKSIKITDKMGVVKRTSKYFSNSNSVTVDLSNLPIGIYYVEVSDGINKTMLPLSILK